MFGRIMDFIFGCRHSRYSFPLTVRAGSRRSANSRVGTYVVCLDCGREFSYDWQQMRLAAPAEPATPARALVTKEAS